MRGRMVVVVVVVVLRARGRDEDENTVSLMPIVLVIGLRSRIFSKSLLDNCTRRISVVLLSI